MQGIGKILKDTREARGITLDEVSEATKIRVKYLEAIEQEEFQLLPGEVYVKGFTTAYLKYLGIKDLPEVVEIMKSQREKPETSVLVQDEDVKEKTASSRSSRHATQPVQRRKAPRAAFEEKPLSKNSSLIIILSIVAIVLLLALQWAYTRSQQEDIPQNDVPQQEEQNSGQESNGDETQNNGDTQEPVTPPEPAAPVYDGLEMQLEILDVNPNGTDQCWMRITADGKSTEMTLSEGQTQSVKAAEKINLNLGNAGVVKITLNGQDLGVQGSQGQVVKKEFKVEDYNTTAQ